MVAKSFQEDLKGPIGFTSCLAKPEIGKERWKAKGLFIKKQGKMSPGDS